MSQIPEGTGQSNQRIGDLLIDKIVFYVAIGWLPFVLLALALLIAFDVLT